MIKTIKQIQWLKEVSECLLRLQRVVSISIISGLIFDAITISQTSFQGMVFCGRLSSICSHKKILISFVDLERMVCNFINTDDMVMPMLMLYAIGSKDQYDKVSFVITQVLYMLLNLPQNTMLQNGVCDTPSIMN